MITLPDYIIQFMKTFEKKGFQIYLVGGAVRDLLMGNSSTNSGLNWDFTTSATPEEILKLFPGAFYHNTYGTVTIPITGKQQDNKTTRQQLIEVTPFRKESDYQDRRHPSKIEWAKTIEEDLARRDFTVNAIAFDGIKILDPYAGQKHIEEKLIVAVGDPDKRFAEDGLRMLRAVRFTAQLGFTIEEKTRLSIQKNADLITKISWERIRDELMKIISSDHPADGVLFLKNTDLLKYILPEVDIAFMIPQKSPHRHHIYDVGTHLVMALKNCPSKDPLTRLATLLHDIGKVKTFLRDEKTGLITFYNHEVVGTKMVKKIADRLRLSNKESEKLVTLVQHHQFSVIEEATDKAIRRFIRNVGKENIQDMLDLRTGDRIGSGAKPTSWRTELFKKRLIEAQKEPFKITDLKINGKDVMEILKIKPGPKVGEVLKKIFDLVVDGKTKNEREELIIYLNKIK